MLLLPLLACTDPAADGEPAAFPDDGCVHPSWEGALPFPNNRLVTRDDTSATGVRLALSQDDMPLTKDDTMSFDATQLDGLDGFSRVAPAVVGFDTSLERGWLDPAGIGTVSDAEAPMFLLDVDAGTVVPGRLAATEDGTTLTVWPDHALRPGALHAIVVRSDTPSTTCLSTGPGLQAAAAAGDTLADEMASARTAAVAAGLADADIAGVVPFTTRTGPGETATMTALRDAAPALLSAGDLSFDTVADCDVDGLAGYCADGVAFAVLGTATLPSWQGDDGTFVTDADGVPAPQGTEDVPFYLLVPESARTVAAPLLVLQHGLGGDKESMLGLAREMVADGHAVVAIDAVGHGDRTHHGDITMGFFGIDFDLWQIGHARDNVRQTAADHYGLHQLLALAAGEGGAYADGRFFLDTEDAAYLGQSLGGIIGASSCALDTGLDRCALNVPGGRLVEIVRANPAYSALMNIYFDPHEQQGEVELFSALAQTVVDPGDPAIAAPEVLATAPVRPLLIQEATDDGTVANQTTELLVRTLGIPLLTPLVEEISGLEQVAMPVSDNVTGGDGTLVTAGLSQFADEHGFVTSGDAEAVRAIAQIQTFLDEDRIVNGE
jgi:hypothetical protein